MLQSKAGVKCLVAVTPLKGNKHLQGVHEQWKKELYDFDTGSTGSDVVRRSSRRINLLVSIAFMSARFDRSFRK
jgi:hypothetical protein